MSPAEKRVADAMVQMGHILARIRAEHGPEAAAMVAGFAAGQLKGLMEEYRLEATKEKVR